MEVKIVYVPKNEIFPKYGYWEPETQTISIQLGLPKCVSDFVLDHELYHSIDPDDGFWATDEREANSSAFRNHPIGGILTILMSLTSMGRIKYYIQRIKTKK